MTCRASRFVACAVVALAAPSGRADVIHVPSEVASIREAVAAAAPGDTVLVAPGNWAQAVVVDGKAVSIVGDGANVRVRSVTVRHLPANAVVLLQNLVVGQAAGGLNDDREAITLFGCNAASTILLRGCSGFGDGGTPGVPGVPFSISDGATGLRVEDCGEVVVVGGSFVGGSGGTLNDEFFEITPTSGAPGIVVRGTRMALFGVAGSGGFGGDNNETDNSPGGDGGAGLLNITGDVHASGCTLTGGAGGNADCDIFNCGLGGAGGDSLRQAGPGGRASVRNNVYLPGSGGLGGDGTPAQAGLPQAILAGTLASYPAPHRGLDATTPVREGQVSTLTITGVPGDLAFLHVGLAPGWIFKPFLQGVYLLPAPLLVVFLGPLPGTSLAVPSVVPELGPGITSVVAHIQLIIGDGTGCRLGPALPQLLLDAAE